MHILALAVKGFGRCRSTVHPLQKQLQTRALHCCRPRLEHLIHGTPSCDWLRSTLTRTARRMTSELMASTDPAAPRSLLDPPTAVRGMKQLDRALFRKQVRVPCLHVDGQQGLEPILRSVKTALLKLDHFKPVQDDRGSSQKKQILLNPDVVRSPEDLEPLARSATVNGLEWTDVEISYENWKADQVLDAILPEAMDKVAGYSRIGHIVHLNLRAHLLDYRHVIGQVLLDKLAGATCVVNKMDTIDSAYRNFHMEVLAGDGNMVADVRENGCRYEFDFSEVFWNPRLSTEHERMVDRMPRHSVLYDVFAGVGPFAVPAARFKKCHVLANDLNPESYKWLQHNVRLNKVGDRVTAHNMDGRDFISDVVRRDMVQRWTGMAPGQDVDFEGFYSVPDLHVVMNLPALAVRFLDAFRGLLNGHPRHERAKGPTVHCYMFCKDAETMEADAVSAVESVLGARLDGASTQVTQVRKVAPNKEMARISFALALDVLYDTKPMESTAAEEDGLTATDERPSKKPRLNDLTRMESLDGVAAGAQQVHKVK